MQPSDSLIPIGLGSGRPLPSAYPGARATRSNEGLPGVRAVLFQRAVVVDPAGCGALLAHGAGPAVAFRLHEALGTQEDVVSRLQGLRPTRSRTYASATALPRAPQGSLPAWVGWPLTGRGSHPLDDTQGFMTYSSIPLDAAAQEEAAEARKSLQGLEESVAEVVAFVRERDPGLTEQEALDRVVEELRERAVDLEDQLTGLKMYSAVSKLGVLGESGTAGQGLRENSPLIRALEGTWDDRDGSLYVRCDQTALAKFSAAAESHPSFPFTHYALSECAFRAGDDAWRQHVDRALEILRHTTRIAGLTCRLSSDH